MLAKHYHSQIEDLRKIMKCECRHFEINYQVICLVVRLSHQAKLTGLLEILDNPPGQDDFMNCDDPHSPHCSRR